MCTWQRRHIVYILGVMCLWMWWLIAGAAPIYAASGSISGTVTDNHGTQLSAIQVDLYQQRIDGTLVLWQLIRQTWSDDNGYYQFTNLDAGIYHLGFRDSRTPMLYATEFYNSAEGVTSATDIPLANGASLSAVNVELTTLPRITGRVTNRTGAPLAGITVGAYWQAGASGSNDWRKVGETYTDVDGVYAVVGMLAGEYRLYFSDQLPPYETTPEYYNDATTLEQGTSVMAAFNTIVTDIDVVLSRNGVLTGLITDEAGTPLHTIAYDLYRFNSSANEWQSVQNGLTNAAGAFSTGVVPGTYRLGFYDYLQPARYVAEFYNNAATKSSATDITIMEGVTTTIRAQLAAVGSIQGRVTASNGAPISAATVTAYRYGVGNDGQSGWLAVSNVNTEGDGRYTLVALPPATYRVGFLVYGQSVHYVPAFFTNAATLSDATDIALAAGQQVTGIDAALDIAGSIRGRVTNTAGEPLNSMTVRLWQQSNDGAWLEQPKVTTTPAGDYQLTDLTAGRYRVGFVDEFAPPQYATEYYNDASVLEKATDLVVSLNMTVTDINAQLGLRSHITGRATNTQGQPLDELNVVAYRWATEGQFAGIWQGAGTTSTDSNGLYDLAYLEQGVYRIEFQENGSRNFYLDEFYNNAYSLDSATSITVPRSTTVPNINITLTSGGGISGKVTNPANQAVADVIVSAWQPQVNDAGDSVWEMVGTGGLTDATGRYTITRLKPGAYRLYFDDFNLRRYAAQYYNNAPTIETATDIQVQADQITPNINAQLAKAAGIQGRVTDPAGQAAPDVLIAAYQFFSQTTNAGWQPILYTSSDSSGAYLLGNLPAGNYRIGFAVTDFQLAGAYVTEYYNNVATIDKAQDLMVSAGQTRTGVDAKLDRRPALAGVVTGANGAPLAQIVASIFYSATSPAGEKYLLNIGMTDTDEQGNYHFADLFVGAYTVCFSDSSMPPLWRSECYNNVRTLSQVTWLTVTANAKLTGINAQLASAAGNTAPVANADTLTVFRGQSTARLSNGTLSLLANDQDNEGDPLGASIETQPAHGTLTLDYEGRFLYTHNGDNAKADRFTYRATDDLGAAASAAVSVTIKPASSIEFTKTVWIAGLPNPCGITNTLRIPVSTTVAYCYTVHNNGIITLTQHSLADDQLGTLLAGQTYTLTPGATHHVIVTQTIAVTTTNVATWTAATSRLAAVEPISATTVATVTLSTPTDDQDQDGIPDVLELVGDLDHDNLPNFLDPDADGDSIPDQVEVGSNPLTPKDSNTDGTPDYLDPFVPLGKRLYLPLIAR